jgi:GNAT superfamily N-acetyltransferase
MPEGNGMDGIISEPAVAEAGDADIPTLARHHRLMFEEIWAKKGAASTEQNMQALTEEYIQKLRGGFRAGDCRAWVVRKGDRVVSSGAVSIVTYVPVPFDPSCRIAFVHSIYTETEERHRGHAGRVVKAALRFCEDERIHRVYLFASEDGRPVYVKNGFGPVDNTMLAVLK